jgi:hypothetical protein
VHLLSICYETCNTATPPDSTPTNRRTCTVHAHTKAQASWLLYVSHSHNLCILTWCIYQFIKHNKARTFPWAASNRLVCVLGTQFVGPCKEHARYFTHYRCNIPHKTDNLISYTGFTQHPPRLVSAARAQSNCHALPRRWTWYSTFPQHFSLCCSGFKGFRTFLFACTGAPRAVDKCEEILTGFLNRVWDHGS